MCGFVCVYGCMCLCVSVMMPFDNFPRSFSGGQNSRATFSSSHVPTDLKRSSGTREYINKTCVFVCIIPVQVKLVDSRETFGSVSNEIDFTWETMALLSWLPQRGYRFPGRSEPTRSDRIFHERWTMYTELLTDETSVLSGFDSSSLEIRSSHYVYSTEVYTQVDRKSIRGSAVGRSVGIIRW